MGKASRKKTSQTTDGVNRAIAKRIAAAERRATPHLDLEAHAARVHDYDLPVEDRLAFLLDPGADIPGEQGRQEIAKVHRLLTQRGWELSAVDFDAIAWDAPIDDQARKLIHSDEEYGEPIASVLTDALFEVPLFTLGLPHRDASNTRFFTFKDASGFAPLLDLVESFHIDDDPAVIANAASDAVDAGSTRRGKLLPSTPDSYVDYGDSDEA